MAENTPPKKISFAEAKQILTAHPEAVLLDVREEEEYLTGHAIDAVLFPVDEISADSAAALLPDQNAPVLAYCRSGRRSREAAEKLASYGYREVYDIGSLIGWPYGLE